MPRFAYREIQPAAALAPFVRTIWTIDAEDSGDARERVEEIHPDGCVEWIVHFADPFVVPGRRGFESQGTHLIAGPSTVTGRFARGGTTAALGIRFAPGAARILGLPPLDTMRDRIVDAADVAPRQLLAVPTLLASVAPRERPRRIELLLLDRFADVAARTRTAPLVAAAQEIQAGASVSAVAGRLGWSERTFERRFAAEVGTAPVFLRGIARFQRALALLADPSSRLVDVAHRAGYSDEAHLCREFRRHAGRTPWEHRRTAAAMTLAFGGSTALDGSEITPQQFGSHP